jgi:hypothetical protein
MRADYDSRGDTLQIELVAVERADRADTSTHPRAVVALRDGGPVAIDLLGASEHYREPLEAVAAHYGLDQEALLAAARSALAAPDRTVILDVLARAARTAA